jgi:hypothetical protein
MNSPTFLRTVLAIGLPLAVIGTIILAIGYINDQQTLRQMANEPQTYLAQDAKLRIEAGGNPQGFGSAIPIEKDEAPYVIFFNATGTAIAGTGVLNNAAPTLPQGVLDVAKKNGVNRLTWEPAPGVRQAIVVMPAGDFFVVAGRSLNYTEEQESNLTKRALVGWVGMIVGVILVSLLSAWILRKRERDTV